MKRVEIRQATVEDAATIAGIKVRGWRWGYRGLLPDAVLDALSLEATETSLRRQLAPEHGRHTWIAAVESDPLGFVMCGTANDPSLPPPTGQIFALYQEARSAGTGVGRALLTHATTHLQQRGCQTAVLWVLESNQRARRFYEIAGWISDGVRREVRRDDYVRREIRCSRNLP